MAVDLINGQCTMEWAARNIAAARTEERSRIRVAQTSALRELKRLLLALVPASHPKFAPVIATLDKATRAPRAPRRKKEGG